jgi:hypothetical protein
MDEEWMRTVRRGRMDGKKIGGNMEGWEDR